MSEIERCGTRECFLPCWGDHAAFAADRLLERHPGKSGLGVFDKGRQQAGCPSMKFFGRPGLKFGQVMYRQPCAVKMLCATAGDAWIGVAHADPDMVGRRLQEGPRAGRCSARMVAGL